MCLENYMWAGELLIIIIIHYQKDDSQVNIYE